MRLAVSGVCIRAKHRMTLLHLRLAAGHGDFSAAVCDELGP